MQRFERTLQAGEWFQLPAGTQFFLYSIAGAEIITARFVAPDGKQIANAMQLPVGFRYGNGLPRADGSDWFQYVVVTNDNATSVDVVIYVAGVGMDLSGVASAVSVTGQVSADVRAAKIAASLAQPSVSPSVVDFCVFVNELNVGTSKRQTVSITSGELDSSLPSAVIVERVDFWGETDLFLETPKQVKDEVSIPSGTALALADAAQVFSGFSSELVNSAGSMNWCRSSNEALDAGEYDARLKSVAGAVESWVPPVPILIARGATHSGSRYIFSGDFSLVNATAGAQSDCGMVIYGRQLA